MIDEVILACNHLEKGHTILYPTDTIWGIGCDATNRKAVREIYGIKQRSDRKSMLVLIDHPSRLTSYIREIPDIAWELIEVADEPITIIYPGAKNLAANLVSEDGAIGIRITSDPFCNHLIKRLGRPIVSTSANISGETAPSSFIEIDAEIKNKVDHVVDWRREESTPSAPSSIIKLDAGGRITVIRA